MTTQSPDQSSSQSPAPSKEMEEKRKELARYFAGRLECTFSPSVYAIEHFDMALKQFAVELGKEREAERAESDMEWVRYTEAATASLKRELAEAQKERDWAKEQWNAASSRATEASTQLLALSASHQRQKEALNLALRAGDPEEAWEPIAKAIQDALAETPDVSLLERVGPREMRMAIHERDREIEALKEKNRAIANESITNQLTLSREVVRNFARGYYCAVSVYLREECAEGCVDTLGESLFKQGGGWEHADPEDLEIFRKHGLIPTLQPDHQK